MHPCESVYMLILEFGELDIIAVKIANASALVEDAKFLVEPENSVIGILFVVRAIQPKPIFVLFELG